MERQPSYLFAKSLCSGLRIFASSCSFLRISRFRPFVFLCKNIGAASLGIIPLFLPIAGCRRSVGEGVRTSGAILFQDAQPGCGIDFPLNDAADGEPGIRETIGRPAALLDADGDGLPDVLVAGPDRV